MFRGFPSSVVLGTRDPKTFLRRNREFPKLFPENFFATQSEISKTFPRKLSLPFLRLVRIDSR